MKAAGTGGFKPLCSLIGQPNCQPPDPCHLSLLLLCPLFLSVSLFTHPLSVASGLLYLFIYLETSVTFRTVIEPLLVNLIIIHYSLSNNRPTVCFVQSLSFTSLCYRNISTVLLTHAQQIRVMYQFFPYRILNVSKAASSRIKVHEGKQLHVKLISLLFIINNMQRVCVLLFVFRVSYAMIPFQLTCSGLPPKRCQEHGQHCAHSLCPGDMFDDNLRSVSSSCVGKLVRRFGKFLETWLVVDSLRLMTCGAVACYSRNVSSL